MDIFNNREIAIGIWLTVAAVWALSNERVRNAVPDIFKAFAAKKIQIVLALMLTYIGFVVLGLSEAGIWDVSQLKNTILWAATVAFVSMVRIPEISKDRHYFRNAVKDNLKLVTILEFIVWFHTLPLWAELIIVPVATIAAALQAYAGTDAKYQAVGTLVERFLMVLGCGLVGYALYQMINDFRVFAQFTTLTDFLIPPILSILFLPFIFGLSVFVAYENALTKLAFLIDDPGLRRFAKNRAILAFGLDGELLSRWSRNVAINHPKTRHDVLALIREVKTLWAREHNPPEVPVEDGWSPYLACRFLEAEGLVTDDYHRVVPELDYWCASSNILDLSTGVWNNQLSYNVDGSERAATNLSLRMDVDDLAQAEMAEERFLEASEVLLEAAIPNGVEEPIPAMLTSSATGTAICDGREVTLSQEPGLKGYTKKMKIETFEKEM